MRQRGRSSDPRFDPAETLFIRFKEDTRAGDKLAVAAIALPDQSGNRSKYSQERDVLLVQYPKFIDWGVARLPVREIPHSCKSPGDVDYGLEPHHDPLPQNYAHSEILVTKSGVRVRDKNKINQTVRKQLRLRIAERCEIIHAARI